VLTTGASVPAGDGFEVTTTSVLADAAKSAAIGDLLSRLAQANRWVQTHADQWLPTYEAQTGLPAAVARQTVLIDESRYVPVGSTVISEEQSIADTFAAQGLIPHVNFAAFVDHRYDQLIRSAG
jgi:sulfonate transport system substrate-binding protein